MEIGSPMACLYLLDNPDHYTSHTFVPFWWRSYVAHVKKYFEAGGCETGSESGIEEPIFSEEALIDGDESVVDRVVLGKENGLYVGKSNVDDYTYRPDAYSRLNLLEWIQTSHKKKRSKKD
ncbi:hypothetical protein CPC08DRAFT_600459, partial [Agrocybe pediades]